MTIWNPEEEYRSRGIKHYILLTIDNLHLEIGSRGVHHVFLSTRETKTLKTGNHVKLLRVGIKLGIWNLGLHLLLTRDPIRQGKEIQTPCLHIIHTV